MQACIVFCAFMLIVLSFCYHRNGVTKWQCPCVVYNRGVPVFCLTCTPTIAILSPLTMYHRHINQSSYVWKVKTTEIAISNTLTVYLLPIHPLVCSWFDRLCIERGTCRALLIIICWSLLDMLFQSITWYWVSTHHAPVLIYQFCNLGFSTFPKFPKHDLCKRYKSFCTRVSDWISFPMNTFIMVYKMLLPSSVNFPHLQHIVSHRFLWLNWALTIVSLFLSFLLT